MYHYKSPFKLSVSYSPWKYPVCVPKMKTDLVGPRAEERVVRGVKNHGPIAINDN